MRYYDLDINGKVKGSYAVPQPDLELILLATAPDDDSKWDGSAWVPDTEKISIREAEETRVAAKAQSIVDNLPSWNGIKTILDGIGNDIEAATTIAALKAIMRTMLVILRRLCRIVYWLAKDKAD